MIRDPNARGVHEAADLAPMMLKFLIAANAAARARRLAQRERARRPDHALPTRKEFKA